MSPSPSVARHPTYDSAAGMGLLSERSQEPGARSLAGCLFVELFVCSTWLTQTGAHTIRVVRLTVRICRSRDTHWERETRAIRILASLVMHLVGCSHTSLFFSCCCPATNCVATYTGAPVDPSRVGWFVWRFAHTHIHLALCR